MFTKKKEQKYNEEIARLNHEVADLKEIIKTQELLKLRAENKRLKEMEQNISKIKFKLRDVTFLQDDGFLLVKYEIPPVKVYVNDEGKIIKNDFFYAVNALRLLSFDDLKKISVAINNIKNEL